MKKLDHFQAPGKLIEGGNFIFNSPRAVRGHLAFYEPCEVIIHFERRKKSKSREQMGYLFGVVYEYLARHTGHSIDEIDAIMKQKFLKNKVVWRGAEMYVVGSKAPLTSNELAEYITNCILEANELGIEIPPADKTWNF